MEDIAGKIQTFHTLSLVCTILAVVCLILAIVLFFVLDIRKVFGYLTGRSAKKQIQALQESSAASGRLIQRERDNMQYIAQEAKEDMGVRGTVTPGARKVEHAVQEDQNFAPQMATEGADATSLLQQTTPQPQPKAQPVVQTVTQTQDENLNNPVQPQQTPVQSTTQAVANGNTAVLNIEDAPMGSFQVEKEIIMIHADEVI